MIHFMGVAVTNPMAYILCLVIVSFFVCMFLINLDEKERRKKLKLQVFDKTHGPTVKITLSNIIRLRDEEIEYLLAEFKRKPDARFSDNLLIACNLYERLLYQETFRQVLKNN